MNNIVWSNKVDEILSNGISLKPIGVKNWALPQEEAIQALSQFIDLQIPILGGDVCEFVSGTIQYNYDNWYCDRLPNESHLDFVNRSIRKAREYIEHYNISEPNKIFFAFVPEV
ncbi:Imm40 family immunity protein [Myroides ceti]|uniref:Imm40 family immunity protein n=1 Tax=Paenimyroides ceti TaxID=395087 RepID=A0ABT8CNR6_9FLAO|nr:Imm40 family immunity protein [Paenimyroides ceti]MDN3705806.1 Imm40 family immunity protein [Paenimyroides ceti]